MVGNCPAQDGKCRPAEDILFPEVCSSCGEAFHLEISEVWHGRDFTVAGCCEATETEALEWLQDPTDGAALMRALGIEHLSPLGSLRRVADDGMGHLELDWQISVELAGPGHRVSYGEVKRFIQQHHGHAKNTNATWRFGGAIWNGPTMLGVIWVGNPVSKELMLRDRGLIEVNRLCLDFGIPDHLRWKAASTAYRWAASEAERRGFTSIQTYTLADEESGMSLRYARWKVLDENAGGKSWNSKSRHRPNKTTPGRKIRWGKKLHPTVARIVNRPLTPSQQLSFLFAA
jgi:hypothetical protein